MNPQDNRPQYILAIDLGTSGCKTALVSTTGAVLGFEFQEVPLYLFPGGGAEQDPDHWWEAVLTTSRKLLDRGLVPAAGDVIAVNCTTQWSGTVAVDKEGRHLMNAVIWMDSRGAPHIREITGGPIRVAGYAPQKLLRWIRLTGGAPTHSGKDSLAHILFIKNERPEIYKNTYKFLEPKDYLNLRFTGIFASSYEAITLHWLTDNRDISRVRYDERLIRMSTVDPDKLPGLWPVASILGPIRKDVAAQLGLPADIPVVTGTPDMHSAAAGAGAVGDYEGHLYIGTSSWITCHVPFKKTDLVHNMATLPAGIPNRYFVADEQETAGACLTFLRDNVLYHKDELLREEKLPNVYKIFDRIAAGVPAGSRRVIFTPWLYGERTPVDDHTLRAGLHNISLGTTREDLIRAFLEGVAYNCRWVLQYVEKFIGRPMETLNIIGGGANSALWCQIFADVLNRRIRQVRDPIQANLRGAALLAAVALGRLRLEDIPKCTEIAAVFDPDPKNRAIYDELFGEFLNIYKKNRGIYRRLNRPGGQ